GEPVRPTTEAAVRQFVVESLRETVPDRDVAVDSPLRLVHVVSPSVRTRGRTVRDIARTAVSAMTDPARGHIGQRMVRAVQSRRLDTAGVILSCGTRRGSSELPTVSASW